MKDSPSLAVERWDSTAWSGAEERQDGQYPAVLVGRLGEAELLEDLRHVGLHLEQRPSGGPEGGMVIDDQHRWTHGG
jgi:hypothetical protein